MDSTKDIVKSTSEPSERRSDKRKTQDQNHDQHPKQQRLRVSLPNEPQGYPSSGLRNTLHGNIFQLKVNMFLTKRGHTLNYCFQLASDMDAAAKFDDSVFKCVNANNDKIEYRFVQAKHKQDAINNCITYSNLINVDGDFGIQKLFISYRRINRNPAFQGKTIELKDFIIYTNIGIAKDLECGFEVMTNQDELFDMKAVGSKQPQRLKLNPQTFPNTAELMQVLRNASELNKLAEKLTKYAVKNKNIQLRDLFKKYHVALANEVIDVDNKKFKREFLYGQNLSKSAIEFRKIIVPKLIVSFKKIEDIELKTSSTFQVGPDLKIKDIKEFIGVFADAPEFQSINFSKLPETLKTIENIELKISSTFGKFFKVDPDPKFENIENFAEVFADAIINSTNCTATIIKVGVIKNNIDKLAGHILVKKEESNQDIYHLTSRYFDDQHTFPGDLSEFRKQVNAKLAANNFKLDEETQSFKMANFQTCEEGQISVQYPLPNDVVSKDEIASFLEKLVFIVDQPNEIQLGEIFDEETGDLAEINLLDSELVASYFQRVVLDWMKEKKGRFFTHEDTEEIFSNLQQKLSSLSMIGPTMDYRLRLENLGIVFNDQHLIDFKNGFYSFLESDKHILNVLSPKVTSLSCLKILQCLRNLQQSGDIQYQKNDSVILISENSLKSLQNNILKSCESNSRKLLIIDGVVNFVRSGFNNFIAKLLKAKQNKPMVKLVIITHKTSPIQFEGYSQIRYQEIEDTENNLTHLTPESQEKMLMEIKLQFQGIETPLGQIIDCENLKVLVDDTIFSRFISGTLIKVGNEMVDLGDVKDYFIPRTFIRRTRITEALLDSIDNVHVTRDQQVDLNNLHQNQAIVVLSDTRKPYDALCEKIELEGHNIYRLAHFGDEIKRTLARTAESTLEIFDDGNYVEEYETENFYKIDEKVIVVAADPGMGKSTSLIEMIPLIKKANPALWVELINLNKYTPQLEDLADENMDAEKAADTLINWLYPEIKYEANQGNEAEVQQRSCERKLFKKKLLFEGGIVLLIDAVDEVYSPSHKDKVLRLLKSLKDTKIDKMFTTTRTYIKETLENTLGVMSFGLKPLSTKYQETYLIKYFGKQLKLDLQNDSRALSYVQALVHRLPRSIQREGTALIIRMVGEIYLDYFSEFYKPNAEKCNLGEKLDIVDLYRSFTNKIQQIHFDVKSQQIPSNFPTLLINKAAAETFEKVHKIAALEHLFGHIEEIKNFKHDTNVRDYINFLKESEGTTGIVQFKKNEKSEWLHATMAEFHAACWLADSANFGIPEVKAFLQKHILMYEFHVVRNFVDRILAKDSKAHLAVINDDKKILERSLPEQGVNCVDKGGRTVLHLVVSYQRNIMLLVYLLHREIEFGIKDKFLGWTPIQYADKMKHWFEVGVLLRKGADPEQISKPKEMEDYAYMALFGALHEYKLIKYIMKQGIEVQRYVCKHMNYEFSYELSCLSSSDESNFDFYLNNCIEKFDKFKDILEHATLLDTSRFDIDDIRRRIKLLRRLSKQERKEKIDEILDILKTICRAL